MSSNTSVRRTTVHTRTVSYFCCYTTLCGRTRNALLQNTSEVIWTLIVQCKISNFIIIGTGWLEKYRLVYRKNIWRFSGERGIVVTCTFHTVPVYIFGVKKQLTKRVFLILRRPCSRIVRFEIAYSKPRANRLRNARALNTDGPLLTFPRRTRNIIYIVQLLDV